MLLTAWVCLTFCPLYLCIYRLWVFSKTLHSSYYLRLAITMCFCGSKNCRIFVTQDTSLIHCEEMAPNSFFFLCPVNWNVTFSCRKVLHFFELNWGNVWPSPFCSAFYKTLQNIIIDIIFHVLNVFFFFFYIKIIILI